MMRCLACNKRLTEFESTVKYATTGSFLDLCNYCRRDLPPDIQVVERSDLQTAVDDIGDEQFEQIETEED